MSTGHRPTWNPAIGQAPKAGAITTAQVSVKDQRGQTVLKYRQVGQSSQSEITAKDFRSELDVKEQQELREKERGSTVTSLLLTSSSSSSSSSSSASSASKTDAPRLLTNVASVNADELRKKYDDADASGDDSDKDLESSDEDNDDDEEDDELELQQELARIKAERAAAQAKKEQEERERDEQKNAESAMKGNPLMPMANDDSAKVKRRWNDDVVFRNQTRDEPEHKKRFINDTIRSDFHRSFLRKFIK